MPFDLLIKHGTVVAGTGRPVTPQTLDLLAAYGGFLNTDLNWTWQSPSLSTDTLTHGR